MLAIQVPPKPRKCTPHLLPLRINHNGPINNTECYFNPTSQTTSVRSLDAKQEQQPTPVVKEEQRDADITQHAYFRGRHLLSTPILLPENYTGAVMQTTNTPHTSTKTMHHGRTMSASQNDHDEDSEQDGDHVEMDVEVMQTNILASFSEVLVWGHAEAVDDAKDAFVRGVREWIGFAEGMHLEEE
ncbi:unnamed protein product [Periconia digitata]|uniref:Uncharacterized protein n=1 Tax=Periconia digitata TaxID=1303443 RepID=A0A9W4UWQ4_9PLEO|nr:unnamed protein product [Periconia digitata]